MVSLHLLLGLLYEAVNQYEQHSNYTLFNGEVLCMHIPIIRITISILIYIYVNMFMSILKPNICMHVCMNVFESIRLTIGDRVKIDY